MYKAMRPFNAILMLFYRYPFGGALDGEILQTWRSVAFSWN